MTNLLRNVGWALVSWALLVGLPPDGPGLSTATAQNYSAPPLSHAPSHALAVPAPGVPFVAAAPIQQVLRPVAPANATDDDGDPSGWLQPGSEHWQRMVELIRENAHLQATVEKQEEICDLRLEVAEQREARLQEQLEATEQRLREVHEQLHMVQRSLQQRTEQLLDQVRGSHRPPGPQQERQTRIQREREEHERRMHAEIGEHQRAFLEKLREQQEAAQQARRQAETQSEELRNRLEAMEREFRDRERAMEKEFRDRERTMENEANNRARELAEELRKRQRDLERLEQESFQPTIRVEDAEASDKRPRENAARKKQGK